MGLLSRPLSHLAAMVVHWLPSLLTRATFSVPRNTMHPAAHRSWTWTHTQTDIPRQRQRHRQWQWKKHKHRQDSDSDSDRDINTDGDRDRDNYTDTAAGRSYDMWSEVHHTLRKMLHISTKFPTEALMHPLVPDPVSPHEEIIKQQLHQPQVLELIVVVLWCCGEHIGRPTFQNPEFCQFDCHIYNVRFRKALCMRFSYVRKFNFKLCICK